MFECGMAAPAPGEQVHICWASCRALFVIPCTRLSPRLVVDIKHFHRLLSELLSEPAAIPSFGKALVGVLAGSFESIMILSLLIRTGW